MVTLTALWLPILLAAVFVFVASSVIHMALPIHKGDYQKMPNEEAVLEQMRKLGVGAGQYMFPMCSSMKDLETPEMKAKLAQGPVGTLIVRGPGGMQMGRSLLQWFLFCIVVSVFVAYITGLGRGPGADGVFRMASAVAVLGYAFSSVCDSIWKGVSWGTTWRFVFDGVVYGLVTGATFAWLWPAPSAI